MFEHALKLPTNPITLNIEMKRDGNGARTCWAANSFLYFSQRLRIPLRGLLPSPASCSAALSAVSSSIACWG